MKGFNDIGEHPYFGQADIFMPELLIKKLWVRSGSKVLTNLDNNLL